MKLIVAGSGCNRCFALQENVAQALENMGPDGRDFEVEHVTETVRLFQLGVAMTPSLIMDGEIVSTGKVLDPGEVEQLLRQARERQTQGEQA